MNAYWTHNTAYHPWIISQAKDCSRVLDVGCGDGLLVLRLSQVCGYVIGIDPHKPSVEKAMLRLKGTSNTLVDAIPFENYTAEAESFDLIIFVASLHHMDQEYCVKKAKTLLAPEGKLLVVGCAKPASVGDWIIDVLRVLPAKCGSFIHGEAKISEFSMITVNPSVSLSDVRRLADRELPGARIRCGLYYRYLLCWTKPKR